MSAPGFMLRASFSASDSALWDADHEGGLRVGVWCSWGRHRVIVQQSLPVDDSPDASAPIGPLLFPLPVDFRGDEHVSFVIMATTHYSGDEGLDLEQHAFVERDIQIGVVSVPLREILALLRGGGGGDADALHRVVIRQTHVFESDAPAAEVARQTYKGTLLLRFERTNAPLPVYRQTISATDATCLLFGTPFAKEKETAMRRLLSGEHMRQFASDSTDPEAWRAVDRDPGVDNFHITEWESDVGVLPTVAYVQHEMNRSRELPRRLCDWARYSDTYARTLDDARVLEGALRATWAAAGLSVSESIAAVDAQLTQSESDGALSPLFVAAVRSMVDHFRGHAIALHYTRDFYYPNRSGHSADTARADLHSATGAGSATRGDAKKKEPDEVPSENWSTAPVTGMANACDCDECGMIMHAAFDVLRDFAPLVGVAAGSTGDVVPLLRALTRASEHFVPFIVQGLVTTAFVDSSGKELAASEVKSLPLRHSPEFAKQHASGHFFFILMTRAHAALLLTRAGHNVARDLPGLLPREPGGWERRFPIMLVEGTATTDMFILPPGEYAPRLFADSAIAREYVADEHARRAQLSLLRSGAPTLFEQLRLYQPPHFIDPPPDPDQTLTPFYRYISQLESGLLYQLNPLYGHLKAVHVPTHSHGLYVGDFLRSVFDGGASGAGLRAIYANLPRAQWDSDVAPVMACLQNQLPLSVMARIQSPQQREMALLQQGHRLNVGTLVALSKVSNGTASAARAASALDRHAIGLAHHKARNSTNTRGTATRLASNTGLAADGLDILPSFTALRASASIATGATAVRAGVTNRAPLIGYLEPWMLRDQARMAQIQTELSAMHATGALEHVAFLRDRKLPHADDQITMRASLRL